MSFDIGVCGLLDALPVLALRTVSATHPARHMTMSFLLGSGLPAETPKTQLLTCFRTEQLYHKLRHLAIGSGKALWAKAAQAGRFIPGLKLLGFHA
jgi:hypothetical protein